MMDLLYVALTVGFFALMLAFVHGAAKLGSDLETSHADDHVAR